MNLTERLAALGQAHSVLTDGSSSAASIRTVIEGALAPFKNGGDRIAVDGPPLELSARHALSLGLAIHELATNAVKYGALSAEGGRVAVSWQSGKPGSDDEFRLVWAESGGPAVEPPSRRGFGSKLIELAPAADFRGQVRLAYEPQGLRCELSTSINELHLVADDDSPSGLPSAFGAATDAQGL